MNLIESIKKFRKNQYDSISKEADFVSKLTFFLGVITIVAIVFFGVSLYWFVVIGIVHVAVFFVLSQRKPKGSDSIDR